MDFEWDIQKAEANERKHGVRFIDAIAIFRDSQRYTRVDNRFDYGERRLVEIGSISDVVFAVTYVVRDDRRRIISARRASRSERARYADRAR